MRTLRSGFFCLAITILAGAMCLAASPNRSPEWWGKAPGQKPTVAGVVANVSATNIAVQTPQGVKPFVVSDKTVVMVRGQKATIADVKVGDQVIVRFVLQNNNVPLAARILVPRPNVRGKIIAIEGNTITLQNPKATNKVVVTPQTEYRSHGYKGTLADLMIGFHAGASGDAGDGVFTAKVIELVPALAEGAVTAIQGDVITVKTVRQLTLNLQGRPGTAVLIRPRVGPNVKGTSADIKVGMPVNVGFIPNKGGNSRLLWIDLLTGM